MDTFLSIVGVIALGLAVGVATFWLARWIIDSIREPVLVRADGLALRVQEMESKIGDMNPRRDYGSGIWLESPGYGVRAASETRVDRLAKDLEHLTEMVKPLVVKDMDIKKPNKESK